MKARLISVLLLLVASSTMTIVCAASDKPQKKMTLAEKGDQAQRESVQLEQIQLQKARDAAKSTAEPEQKALAKTQSNDWEVQQRKKAQTHSNERAAREQKYLQQAQEAATQTRKIPKETRTEPISSE